MLVCQLFQPVPASGGCCLVDLLLICRVLAEGGGQEVVGLQEQSLAFRAGLAHLAVLCGAPLLLITHNGLVAPGPVSGSEGQVLEPGYWTVRLEEYYQRANHTGSPINVSNAWQSPETVLEEIRDILDA